MLCGQNLEDIEKITFNSTGNFVIAYNNLDGSGTITEYNKDPYWSQIEGASSYELDLTNINFETYNFVVALSNNEGKDYTITWEVVLKDDQSSQPEGGDQGGNEGQIPEGGDQGGNEGDEPTEPQPEVGKGSLVFTEQTGWIQKNITKEQLFCGVELNQIAGFKFSSTTNVYVGFSIDCEECL